MNRLTPGCYPANGAIGPGGLRQDHRALGRTALRRTKWFAVQDDGSFQHIGTGDIGPTDLLLLARDMKPEECFVIIDGASDLDPAVVFDALLPHILIVIRSEQILLLRNNEDIIKRFSFLNLAIEIERDELARRLSR